MVCPLNNTPSYSSFSLSSLKVNERPSLYLARWFSSVDCLFVETHSQKLGMLYSESWFTDKLESMGFVIPASSIFS